MLNWHLPPVHKALFTPFMFVNSPWSIQPIAATWRIEASYSVLIPFFTSLVWSMGGYLKSPSSEMFSTEDTHRPSWDSIQWALGWNTDKVNTIPSELTGATCVKIMCIFLLELLRNAFHNSIKSQKRHVQGPINYVYIKLFGLSKVGVCQTG